MVSPQPSLFADELSTNYHLEFTVRAGIGLPELVAALRDARRAAAWVGAPNVVWGYGPDLWRQLAPTEIPAQVRPFGGIKGANGLSAPATQRDVWAWFAGNAYEAVWKSAYGVRQAMEPVADLAFELSAYKAHDSRDPSGFIDGTENPLLDEALEVAVFGEQSPGVGGSAVLIQKWLHDLPAFTALSLPAQEDVIGRSRETSIQLEPAVMPPTSHVSRNTVLDADGEERHIYRRNTPFASTGEVGTLFIGCTNDPGLMDTMLDRMFGIAGDGLIDHLANFSTPVTGSYYFVPAMAALTATLGSLDSEDAGPDEVADVLGRSNAETSDLDAEPDAASTAGEVSLRIGSLLATRAPMDGRPD